MARRVVILQQPINRRSDVVCHAMAAGLRRAGQPCELIQSRQYTTWQHDVAIFYGLHGRLTQVMAEFSRHPARRAVYIDLGYFGRRTGGKLYGYHKISVDSRHPTAYFQQVRHDRRRIDQFGLRARPWRHEGAHILLAGMAAKAASAEGLIPEAWEKRAVAAIRRVTDRPIIYRPKPNYAGAPAIPGTIYTAPDSVPLEEQLQGCHAVVSHHSNTNVDGLIAGIPSFTMAGVADVMGLRDLAKIEAPSFPEGRDRWLADVAYTQWSVSEMAEGLPWRHLLDEGIIP